MKIKNIELGYLNQNELLKWDEFVQKHPDGTIFHTSVFLNAVSAPVGRELKVLCLLRDSEIVGGFAFASFKKSGLNIIPVPYECPVFHPLISERESQYISKKESFYNSSLTLLLQHLKKEYSSFGLVFSPNIKDLRPYSSNGLKLDINYTYLSRINEINLQKPVIDPSTKRQIAKAARHGYSISTKLSQENIDAMFTLLQETYSRKGLPLRLNKDDYTKLFHSLGEKHWMHLFVLRFGDKPAAAIAFPVFNKTAHYWISASAGDLSKLGAPSALLLEVIDFLKKHDVEIFDLVGANTQSVARFKAGFNFELDYSNTASYATPIYNTLWGVKQFATKILK